VEARLATVVARSQFADADGTLAKPKLALRHAARKDEVCKLLDLLSHCLIGGLPHARSAVVGASSYADQDVLLRPVAFVEDFPQLGEVDFELCGAVGQCGPILDDCGVCALAQSKRSPCALN
jgi:hypothetical protein